jgi:seryl-tRNA synthetase
VTQAAAEAPGTAQEQAFLAGLVEHRLLVPTGVPGVFGRGAAFEGIVLAFDALVARETAQDGAELVRFPPVLPREQLERSGYLKSFPHLAGSVFSFAGGEGEAFELGERASRHEDWSEFQTMAEVCLLPAACYPVYPWLAARGPLPAGGRLVDVCSYCFRHEPSGDPARMQSFRMHEHVRIGEPGELVEWQQGWIERGREILSSVGLDAVAAPASDPFFGRAGRMLSANQREQGLKYELVYPICSTERPTPIMSINYHQDHFGLDFGIRTAAGDVAHTACLGFGLERIALALLRTHGFERERWPDVVADRLFGA